MKTVVIPAMILLFLLLTKPGEAGLSCEQVRNSLIPCIPYLTTTGGTPTPDCCNGVKSIKDGTPTVDDRRAACDCVKQAAAAIPAIKDDSAAALPQACKVELNIPISRTTDCSKIN